MPNKQVLAEKKEEVKGLVELMNGSSIGILVDYRGLTVSQDTELRNKLREAGVSYSVIKNSLARFAAPEANLSELEPQLHGPTAMATTTGDIVAPAKVLAEFAKSNESLQIKGGFMEGKVVDAATIEKLAKLPPKEVLIAQVLGGLNSPITGLVNVLNGNITGLVRVLGQIRDKAA